MYWLLALFGEVNILYIFIHLNVTHTESIKINFRMMSINLAHWSPSPYFEGAVLPLSRRFDFFYVSQLMLNYPFIFSLLCNLILLQWYKTKTKKNWFFLLLFHSIYVNLFTFFFAFFKSFQLQIIGLREFVGTSNWQFLFFFIYCRNTSTFHLVYLTIYLNRLSNLLIPKKTKKLILPKFLFY